MGFREFIHGELIAGGIIDEDVWESELSVAYIIGETDLDETDIDDFRGQYKEACQMHGWEPEFDLPEN